MSPNQTLLPLPQKDSPIVPAWPRSVFSMGSKYSRLCVLFATILLLSMHGTTFATPLRVNVVPLYSCGNGQTGHCYANQNWSGGTPGSRSSIFTNQIYSDDCFVTNEMWLATPSRQYWVEAGMISDIADQYGMESLF